MNNVVKVEETKVAINPMVMIANAIEKGIDSEQLQKMMDLQERYEANEARKAYMEAMTAFKRDAITITKDKLVSFGGTSYTHASLANVVRTVTERLAEYGLMHNWKTKQLDNGQVQVTCIITHKLGHSEETTLQSAPDNSGKKNNIQAIGSAVSYLQRYTLLAATGIATDDQDDDAVTAEDRINITEAQAIIIDKLITASGGNDTGFLNFYNINSVAELQQRDYKEAIKVLERKVRKAGK